MSEHEDGSESCSAHDARVYLTKYSGWVFDSAFLWRTRWERGANYREKTKHYSFAFRLQGKQSRFVTLLSLDKRATLAHVDDESEGVRVRFALGGVPYEFRVYGGKLVAE